VIVIFFLSTITWWTTVVWYQVRSRWYANPFGRSVMGIDLSLAVLSTLLFMGEAFGHESYEDFIYILLFIVLTCLAIRRIHLIETAQRSQRDQ